MNTSQPSVLDQGITQVARKRLEYLRGKEPTVGMVIKALSIGGIGLWFFRHIDQVNNFFDGMIDLGEKVIYGGVLVIVGWAIWQIVSSKWLRDMVSGMIDSSILRLHKWWISRDPFGVAEFSILRLLKGIRIADDARAVVLAAYTSVVKSIKTAAATAQTAFNNAKGFQEELERRKRGEEPQIKMSTEGLQRAFANAKSTLRIQNDFLKGQIESRDMLGRRCSILKEVVETGKDKVAEMQEQLRMTKESWELQLQTLRAVEKSDDVLNSQDAMNFKEAIGNIAKETDFYNGRVLMLMDNLDPAIQAHRTQQAGNQVADEACFNAFLKETKTTLKNPIFAPAEPDESALLVEDADRLLSDGTESRSTTAIPTEATAPAGNGSSRRFESILRK